MSETVVASDIVGQVKWFNAKKGYGFLIGPEPECADVFLHFSSIGMEGYKTLNKGDYVRYDLVSTDRGPQARNIRLESVAQEM